MTKSGVEIRAMRANDVDGVFKLLSSVQGTPLLDWETPDVFADFVQRCPRQAYVGVDAGEIVACAFLSDGLRGFLHHVAVAESYRRHRVATEVVTALLRDFCQRTGVRRIQTVILSGNEPSLAACRNSGWTEATGRTEGFFLDLDA